MFSLKGFIKKGLLNAVGKMADYQVILNSAAWMEKGVLTENDLADIQTAIEAQYAEADEGVEEIAEDFIEESTE